MPEIELTLKQWREIYSLPVKCTKDSRLLWLQYKLLHRILQTNCYLHIVGILNSSLCYFLKQTLETIEHIFVKCYLVKEIRIKFEKWTIDIVGVQTYFDKYSIFFKSMIKYDKRDIHTFENLIFFHQNIYCERK